MRLYLINNISFYLNCALLCWHFVDVIWLFLFSFIYIFCLLFIFVLIIIFLIYYLFFNSFSNFLPFLFMPDFTVIFTSLLLF